MPIVADAAVAIRGDLSKFSSDLNKAEKQTQTLGGKLKNALSPGNLAAGLAGGFAVSQIGQFLGDAIGAASDLAETQSKVKIVFGESAKVIEKMGKTSATALGMSENAALAAAGTYGNLFRAMGITEQASADMSVGLVGLAADLASFNNMNPTEVLDKLRAGLSGETEPLRALGVNLNVAAIAAKAMEMGIASSAAELTPAIKAQATYALILEQTSLAQGDFSRTADGLANTQRVLNAEMENLSADIGRELLPVMVDVMHTFRDMVPHIKKAIPVLVNITGAVVNLGRLAIPLLVAVVGIKLVAAFKAAEIAGVGSATAIKVAWGAALLGIPLLFEHIREEQEKAVADMKDPRLALPWDWLIGSPFREVVEDTSAALEAESRRWAGIAAAELTAGEPKVAGAATSGLEEPVTQAISRARIKAREEAAAIPGDVADALIKGQADIEAGMKTLTDLMNDEWTDASRIAYLKGLLIDEQLLAGLASNEADERGTAITIRENILAELRGLETGAYDVAVDTGTTLAEQFRLQDAVIGKAAADAMRQARHEFSDTSYAESGGHTIGTSWLGAMIASIGAGKPALVRAVSGVSAVMGRSLPTEGPLQHPERGGRSIAEAWMEKGLIASLRAGLGDVTAALPTLGANGGLPSLSPLAMGAAGAASGATINNTNNWHLTVGGVPYTFSTRDDFIKALDDLSGFGADGRLG